MPVDMFIKIKDIPGESRDAEHKDWIDLLSWSWGMENPGRASAGAGRGGGGRVNVQDLSFSHPVDKASPDLMLHCASGKHIPEAILVVRKAGGEAQREDYYFLSMENILVTSVSTGGAGGEDLAENVTLNFTQVKVKYIEQDEKGGVKSVQEFGWDIAKNSPA